jgi:hypothetical protein
MPGSLLPKSDQTRLVRIVNEKRNYGTYGIHGNYGNKQVFSVNSVYSVCPVVFFLFQCRVVRFSSLLPRLMLVLFLMLLPAAAGVAAQKSAPQKTGAGKPAPAQQSVGASETSCDGALEIVPAKATTFTRKRRPARAVPASSEAKSELKQDGESQI